MQEAIVPIEEKIPSKKSRRNIAVLLILLVTFLIFSSAFFFLSEQKGAGESKIANLPAFNPTPTPFPFNELTVPYLRSRDYKSELGNLSPISENSEYQSFTTSYTSDNLKINGLLTKPKGEMPQSGWPAIIFVHGYIPPASYRTTQNYASYTDYFSRNGFVVFKIDLRGHGESEGESGGAYYSSDYIVDVLSAHSALQSSDFVKSGSIGLWGHSMAGNVVMRSLAAKPDIKAIVIWAGAVYTYVDFAEFGISDASYQTPADNNERAQRRQRIRDLYGEPSRDSEFWKAVAPTSFLGDIEGAVQIHHAVNDNIVDIRYSRNLNNLLDGAQIDNEFYEYNDGGHNLTGSSFNTAMERSVRFFRETLN